MCGQFAGATGCEGIWNQSNKGCYVHTSKRITQGNKAGNHVCWVIPQPMYSTMPVGTMPVGTMPVTTMPVTNMPVGATPAVMPDGTMMPAVMPDGTMMPAVMPGGTMPVGTDLANITGMLTGTTGKVDPTTGLPYPSTVAGVATDFTKNLATTVAGVRF